METLIPDVCGVILKKVNKKALKLLYTLDIIDRA